ncbi:MAG: hypothetical protein V3T23_07530 [Nitrososphaerales archaeon]
MKTEYVVYWKEWQGVESCGRGDYLHRSKKFEHLHDASEHFVDMSRRHERAKLKMITETLLDESDD